MLLQDLFGDPKTQPGAHVTFSSEEGFENLWLVVELDAGAEILKPPQDTFYGGYAGYFRDPNGHVWEVVWNPAILPSDG